MRASCDYVRAHVRVRAYAGRAGYRISRVLGESYPKSDLTFFWHFAIRTLFFSYVFAVKFQSVGKIMTVHGKYNSLSLQNIRIISYIIIKTIPYIIKKL